MKWYRIPELGSVARFAISKPRQPTQQIDPNRGLPCNGVTTPVVSSTALTESARNGN
jgi:hypothetical protein